MTGQPEIRKHQMGEFSFFATLEEAKPYINTTFNVAEMPVGGYFAYKDNIYRVHHYENNDFQLWVTNPEGELKIIDPEENGLYLGENYSMPQH